MTTVQMFLIMAVTLVAPLLRREFAMTAAEVCIGLALIFFAIHLWLEK